MPDGVGSPFQSVTETKTVAAKPLTLRLAGSRRFHRFAARVPVLRWFARREGEALFDLVSGFCQSQMLFALVRLGVLADLQTRPRKLAEVAQATDLPAERARLLLRAGQAMKLCRPVAGRWRLTPRGAALLSVPGLAGMIAHHDVLYRDLADPVAFLRGDTDPELARFWPYVFGAEAAADPDVARRYSALMADSMALVAEDTLATGALKGVRHLMDVGGGTGAFLVAALSHVPRATLFDLPAVVAGARPRFEAAGLSDRVRIAAGSFTDDPLPTGSDAISLVRILYDHDDATVAGLLAKCHAALPAGGRLIVSEPMLGEPDPQVAGDIYFALYCLAMRTGKARSPAEIAAQLRNAGFARVHRHPSRRPFVTSVLTAVKPA